MVGFGLIFKQQKIHSVNLIVFRLVLLLIFCCFLFSCESKVEKESDITGIVNQIVKTKFPKADLIIIDSEKVHKVYTAIVLPSNKPSTEPLIPPPPPPPGYIYFDKTLFSELVNQGLLDSTEAEFMYNSIDSSKSIIFDYKSIGLKGMTRSEFNSLINQKRFRGVYQYLKHRLKVDELLLISTPVFTSSRNKVLINFISHCGRYCGGSVTFLLEKRAGKWRILDESNIWIK